jgi:hypothetical protein
MYVIKPVRKDGETQLYDVYRYDGAWLGSRRTPKQAMEHMWQREEKNPYGGPNTQPPRAKNLWTRVK